MIVYPPRSGFTPMQILVIGTEEITDPQFEVLLRAAAPMEHLSIIFMRISERDPFPGKAALNAMTAQVGGRYDHATLTGHEPESWLFVNDTLIICFVTNESNNRFVWCWPWWYVAKKTDQKTEIEIYDPDGQQIDFGMFWPLVGT